MGVSQRIWCTRLNCAYVGLNYFGGAHHPGPRALGNPCLLYTYLYYKVILSVCMCALGSAKLPNGFEKFFLRLVDLNVDIVRKILNFYELIY